jgi:hypothetical protein
MASKDSRHTTQAPWEIQLLDFLYSEWGVKNQLLVSPEDKRILSVSESVEGKRADKKLFEDDPISLMFPKDSVGMGDKAYLRADQISPYLRMIRVVPQ